MFNNIIKFNNDEYQHKLNILHYKKFLNEIKSLLKLTKTKRRNNNI